MAKALISGLLLGLSAAVPVRAANVAADPQTIAKLLQGAGYQAKLEKDRVGDPMITSSSSGSTFGVYFYGCKNGKNCLTIQFQAGYDVEPSKAPTLAKINDWNRTRRFGTGYLDDEGDPAVKFDLDLEDGGVSPALLIDNLEYWTATMAEFEKHIGW